MHKMFKRVLALALMAMLIIGCFAGCYVEDERPEVTVATKNEDGLYTTDPVTITVAVARHPEALTGPDEIWFFPYLEWWFAQQGYDVTINVQETNSEQVKMMLNTNTLPDIIWSVALSNTDTVRYGVEEHMILDWTPYLTEELMPNLCAQYEANPSMKAAQTAPDGGIYGLPYITPYPYSTIPGMTNRMYVRQSWLDAVGLDMPTTEQEFLDMLRAFKNVKIDGKKTVPMISDVSFLEKYLWTCLGYYGSDGTRFGTGFMIKDEQVYLPAYTEDYRHFVTLMNTMYTEGLLPSDYFTLSSASAIAMINDGVTGVHGWWTLQYVGEDYADQNLLGPIPMGSNDDVYVSRLSDYKTSTVWVSADTQYPEVVAMMLDYLYSEEGSMLYMYGPKQGEDPLGMVDGWYLDEEGRYTTSMVGEGKPYSVMELYARDYIRPNDSAGYRVDPITNGTGEIITYKDAVTGLDINLIHDRTMTRSSNDEWWRLETIEVWSDYATAIRLPSAYLDIDTMEDMTDIQTAVNQWINQETAKFITGVRPLSEVDQFFNELKSFGVEDYIAAYREAYAPFMEGTYGK